MDCQCCALDPTIVERIMRVTGFKRGRERCLVEMGDDGRLRGDCTNCSGERLPILSFAPRTCMKNCRREGQFRRAVGEWESGEQGDSVFQRIVKTRHSRCNACQSTYHIPPRAVACRDLFVAARRRACEEQDGCANRECTERGPAAEAVLQGDHVDPSMKVHALGDYMWWAWNGGVDAMSEELPKVRWLCAFCHQLETTSTAARRCGDPELMPDGNSSKTSDGRSAYNSKFMALRRYPKMRYVDDRKLEMGSCQSCDRTITERNTWCFHFDHLDEESKTKGKGTVGGVKGGVGGIVGNARKDATLEHVRELLDAEMDKCQLLCVNCHHRKTVRPRSCASFGVP